MSERIQLIGFNGGMGCGKSTAIKTLEAHLGFTPKLIKFAGPLYEMQEFIYKRIESVYQRPGDFVKDRKLLQWIGTEWGRDTIDQELWVRLWQADVNKALDQGYTVVCDDVRFNNEAALIHAFGGKLVKIESSFASSRIDTAAGIKGHASEAGISDTYIDALIKNDGTLEDFKASLASMFLTLGI